VSVPFFGLVQVAQPGQHVGVAETASALGFPYTVAGPLGQREGLLKVRQTAGILLQEEDVPEFDEGDGEVADLIALVRGEAGGGDVQRRGGLGSVPGGPGLLEGGGGGPVPRLPREPHPVARDNAPLLFAARQRSFGGGVGEVGGDGGDDLGPYAVPPGPLIQDDQALQAGALSLPQPGRAGEVEGMAQVGFLGP
jgi:hypothetical protein